MPVPPDPALAAPRAVRSTSNERFPRSARLLRRGDFLRVQQAGKRVHTAHFIILVSPWQNAAQGSRLGVTVGKRIGCAVRRNRIKRVVREVYRRNRDLFPVDCDVVLVARSGAQDLDYGSVKDELTRAQAALSRLTARAQAAKVPTDPAIARFLLLLIRGYQRTLSPLLGPVCRFSPSCSNYMATCIERFGAARGGYLGLRRLLRCHPFHPGGIDLPPSRAPSSAPHAAAGHSESSP